MDQINTQYGISNLKKKTMKITTELYIFGLVQVLDFSYSNVGFLQWVSQKKRLSIKKRKKPENYDWVVHIQISLSTKFQLKLTILIFWYLPKKDIYSLKKTKLTPPLHFEYSNWVRYQILFWTILNFWTWFALTLFLVKNRKTENRQWVLHIRTSLGTKFQLKLTILIFLTKFAQKVISGRKWKNRTCACVHSHYLLY